MTYVLQQQIVGSSHWTVFATGVRDTSYTVLALTRGIWYAFRVLTATAKANSKPSPPTDPVQLLDRGKMVSKQQRGQKARGRNNWEDGAGEAMVGLLSLKFGLRAEEPPGNW